MAAALKMNMVFKRTQENNALAILRQGCRRDLQTKQPPFSFLLPPPSSSFMSSRQRRVYFPHRDRVLSDTLSSPSTPFPSTTSLTRCSPGEEDRRRATQLPSLPLCSCSESRSAAARLAKPALKHSLQRQPGHRPLASSPREVLSNLARYVPPSALCHWAAEKLA